MANATKPVPISNRRRPVSEMEDDQRKAMFARMGRGGGGSRPVPVQQHGASGSWDDQEYNADAHILDYTPGYEGYHPEDITSTNPADLTNPRRMADRENLRLDRENEHSPILSLLRDLSQYLPGYSEGDLYGILDDTMMASMSIGMPAFPAPASAAAAAAAPTIKNVSTLMKFLKAAALSVGSGLGAYGLGEYRDSHARLHPASDHILALLQDGLSMISALSGLRAGTTAVGAAGKAIHKGMLNFENYDKSATLLSKGLEAVRNFPALLGSKFPSLAKIMSPLSKAYTFVSDYTGSEAPALLDALSAPSNLALAKQLKFQGEIPAALAPPWMKSPSFDPNAFLKSAYSSLSLTQSPVQRATLKAEIASARGIAQLNAAARIKKDSIASLVKAGLATAAATSVHTFEQSKVAGYKADMIESFNNGEPFKIDADYDYASTGFGAVGSMAAGTLGNPVEKQWRNFAKGKYTSDPAQRAYQEVRFEDISRRENSGEISKEQADAEFQALHEQKPWNMAGASIYTVQPAVAGFLKYGASKLKDYATTQKDIGQVVHVADGDTIKFRTTDGVLHDIRLSGVDTPETVHPDKPPEYYGPEASAYTKSVIEEGDWIRLARDSKNPDQLTDKYDRDLGYVERLPDVVDQLFRIPGIGKLIPAQDFNKTLIEKGFGQPRYLELSEHYPERTKEYDLATQIAKANKVGIWSDEGMEKLAYHYEPKYTDPSSSLSMPIGMGLMVSGNSGIFRTLGDSGGHLAQLWNAAAAVAGSYEHQQTGMKNKGKRFSVPKGWQTDEKSFFEDLYSDNNWD